MGLNAGYRLGTRHEINSKKPIDQDKMIAANYLFYEEKLPQYKIEKQLRIGQATIDRYLLPTFQAWREFRKSVEMK